MSVTADLMIYWGVILARVLVPLTIPRYPLPGILAALILDAVDQTIFQGLSGVDLSGYQGYDKALDIYYLAVAYIATLRNWTSYAAVRISRFLFYYRLVGVVLFELTGARWLLLVFPNVFEYFFIVYEAYRLRWDPLRLSARRLMGIAAAIWIVVKLPQEYWIHVAQLDVTDMVKNDLLGYPAETPWGEVFSANATMVAALFLALAILIFLLQRRLRGRLPPADWRISFQPDAHLIRTDPQQRQLTTRILANRLFDHELLEKTALISLLVIIFAQIMPAIRSTNVELGLAAAIVIIINTLLSEWLARRGVTWQRALRQGIVMFGVNLPVFVIVSYLRYGAISWANLANIVIFVLLLSLIITLYDRYRPIYLIRFYGYAALDAISDA